MSAAAAEEPRHVALASADPYAIPLIDPNFFGDRPTLNHGRGLQDHQAADGDAGATGAAEEEMFTEGVAPTTTSRGAARARRHRLSPVGTARMGVNDRWRWSIRS